MILLALLGVAGFSFGMVSAPQEQVVYNSGLVLLVGGSLLLFFYTVRLLIDAFKESALHGLLSLLFPPYIAYFVMSRWDRVGVLFIFQCAGGVLVGAGYWMMFVLAPIFQRMAA
jgi:hypothetical protein